MPEKLLDATDRAIFFELQVDARLTNTEIADRIGVSMSTVGKRFSCLEEAGIVEKYQPKINYTATNSVLHMQFVCTAPVADRESLVQAVLRLDPVVRVNEVMPGQRNVFIEVVGQYRDITQVAERIDELGLTINNESLVRNTHTQPAGVFQGSTPKPTSQANEE